MPATVTCVECFIAKPVKEIKVCSKCRSMICLECIPPTHKCQAMRITRIDDFIKEKENITWLVDELLPDMGWTLLYGIQGSGKSTFALQLCSALQKGSQFISRKCLQRNVLYIQADSIEDEWRAIIQRVASDITAWTMVNVPNGALTMPNYQSGLHTLIKRVNPGFVVFDSLYTLSGEDINTKNVLLPINAIKAMLGTVPWLLIHHCPHDKLRASGHNSLAANCSNEWGISETQLHIKKGRVVKKGVIPLSRDENGLWYSDSDLDDNLDDYVI